MDGEGVCTREQSESTDLGLLRAVPVCISERRGVTAILNSLTITCLGPLIQSFPGLHCLHQ